MQDRKNKITKIKAAFDRGFMNASSALSKISTNAISYTNFHYGSHKINDDGVEGIQSFQRTGSNILITTEIFGDLAGKSYFLLTKDEFEILSKKGFSNGNVSAPEMREEFIKELDNILSASVITILSNELGVRIYGDVPTFVAPFSGNLCDAIYDDFNDSAKQVYVNAMFFSFEKYPEVTPFFVWALDEDVLATAEAKVAHVNREML